MRALWVLVLLVLAIAWELLDLEALLLASLGRACSDAAWAAAGRSMQHARKPCGDQADQTHPRLHGQVQCQRICRRICVYVARLLIGRIADAIGEEGVRLRLTLVRS